MNSWPFCFNLPNSGTASICPWVLILLCMKKVNSTFAQWQSIYRLKDTIRLSHIRCLYLLHSLRHQIKNWQYLCSACILHNKTTISPAARSLLSVTKSWITRTLKLWDQTGTPFLKTLCALCQLLSPGSDCCGWGCSELSNTASSQFLKHKLFTWHSQVLLDLEFSVHTNHNPSASLWLQIQCSFIMPMTLGFWILRIPMKESPHAMLTPVVGIILVLS